MNMATITVTVSFGEKDAILWRHIENAVGTPVTSSKIRNLLYEWMDTKVVVERGNLNE